MCDYATPSKYDPQNIIDHFVIPYAVGTQLISTNRNIELLTFEIYTYKTSNERHFSISGDQGNQWHKLKVDLPLEEET